MTSRERVRRALRFLEPDQVPLDLGGTRMSWIHAESYARLKRALGVRGGAIRVYDLYQMICEVELPVVERLGVDLLPVQPLRPFFGLDIKRWRPYRFWWTPSDMACEVPADFAPTTAPDGSMYLADGDPAGSRRPARMPPEGWHFDRTDPTGISERIEFEPIASVAACLTRLDDAELDLARLQTETLYRDTDKSLVGGFYLGGMGPPSSLSFAD